MRTDKKKISFVTLVITSIIMALTLSAAFGDDLNPPPYRGGPLSVNAEWQFTPGTTILNLTQWSSVDDSDPTTYLYPSFTPTPTILPNGDIYQLQLPNWVDNEPIKYLRLQLAWVGTPTPPVNIFTQGLDGVNLISGLLTFTSPLVANAATGSTYQYYDFEFKPNPDFERVHVQVAPNTVLSQIVIDTVSTIPEPATVIMMTLGGIGLLTKRRTLQ